MKKLFLIVSILVLMSILAGCYARPIEPTTITTYKNSGVGDVSRFIDEEAGVICWLSVVYSGYDISCLPLSETLLGSK